MACDIAWDKLDDIVESLRRTHDIPGVSLAIVCGSEAVSRGYGKVSLASDSNNVTEKTAFCVGSVTKGFTAVLLASILQDKRDITWDTPLVKIFGPSLQFCDQFRSEEACLRDILSHKMGFELGETDFGWLCEGMSRKDVLNSVKHLPSSASFRTKLMYNNFMYALAGMVAERLTDMPWEALIEENIFGLLGMEDSTFIDRVTEDHNVALPHLSVNGELQSISLDVHRGARLVGPAATICCGAQDMTKWMTFLLNSGSIGDIPVIKKPYFTECWKPQFALPQGKPWDGYVYRPVFPVTESRDTYGFGFYLGSYRGHRYVAHQGELFGYDCQLTLYPDMNIGVYTATNGPGGDKSFVANQLIHYYASDLCLGENPWLDPVSVATFPEPWQPKEKVFFPREAVPFNKSIPASRALAAYQGTYSHGCLGDITVNVQGEKLSVFYGRIGQFNLYPDGVEDEFRMEGCGVLGFLHNADMFTPSNWMMVKFCSETVQGKDTITALICSLFEASPVFQKQLNI